jgi:hypothetical protein
MKRLFIASHPYSISNVIPEDWYSDHIPNWFQMTESEDPSECLVEPLLGFNPDTGIFEKPVEGASYCILLVDDDAENPLSGQTITSEDYLVYHEATRNNKINALFDPLQKKAAKHEQSSDKSDYALAFSILCDDKGNKFERMLEAIFPFKREILCFLSQLNGDVLPAIPAPLEALRDEYVQLMNAPQSRVSSPDTWFCFVDKCLEISRSL